MFKVGLKGKFKVFEHSNGPFSLRNMLRFADMRIPTVYNKVWVFAHPSVQCSLCSIALWVLAGPWQDVSSCGVCDCRKTSTQ